jgi:hypothetical protein
MEFVVGTAELVSFVHEYKLPDGRVYASVDRFSREEGSSDFVRSESVQSPYLSELSGPLG